MTPLPPAAEEDTFFRLLRIASGCGGELPRKLTEEEWLRMADLAKRQALGGILMQAVEQLPPADRPPQRILFQWIGWTGKIENVNRRLNSAATAVSLYFKEKGFRPTILKGQGAAETYPNPLRRTPGDIDVWIEGDRKRIFRLARTIDPKAKAVYHHIDMKGLSEEFEVELHTTPSWMNNPFTNRKLQRMFRRWAQENAAKEITLTGAGSVRVPSDEMNRVFLLVHIYRHLMADGLLLPAAEGDGRGSAQAICRAAARTENDAVRRSRDVRAGTGVRTGRKAYARAALEEIRRKAAGRNHAGRQLRTV